MLNPILNSENSSSRNITAPLAKSSMVSKSRSVYGLLKSIYVWPLEWSTLGTLQCCQAMPVLSYLRLVIDSWRHSPRVDHFEALCRSIITKILDTPWWRNHFKYVRDGCNYIATKKMWINSKKQKRYAQKTKILIDSWIPSPNCLTSRCPL